MRLSLFGKPAAVKFFKNIQRLFHWLSSIWLGSTGVRSAPRIPPRSVSFLFLRSRNSRTQYAPRLTRRRKNRNDQPDGWPEPPECDGNSKISCVSAATPKTTARSRNATVLSIVVAPRGSKTYRNRNAAAMSARAPIAAASWIRVAMDFYLHRSDGMEEGGVTEIATNHHRADKHD